MLGLLPQPLPRWVATSGEYLFEGDPTRSSVRCLTSLASECAAAALVLPWDSAFLRGLRPTWTLPCLFPPPNERHKL